MAVRRNGKLNRVYYHCSRYYSPLLGGRCSFNRFVPVTWDEVVWSDLCLLLRDEEWVEAQAMSAQAQQDNVDELMRTERSRLAQARAKVARVQEGFESAVYTVDEAKQRIGGYQVLIDEAEKEINRLQDRRHQSRGDGEIEEVKRQLRDLRDRNLDNPDFADRVDVVAKLGMTVHPSDDLASMRVSCSVSPGPTSTPRGGGVAYNGKAGEELGQETETRGGIVTFAPPQGHYP